MKRNTTRTLLGLGGLAGGYYLVRHLVRGHEGAEVAAAEASLAEATSRPPEVRPVPARPTPKPAEAGVPRTYDRIFAEHGHGLPLAYLRALAKRESDMNPNETEDPAWGLLQVIEVVRNDYNKRHGTSHTRRELLDQATNVTIATDLIRRIIDSYQRNHPNVPNLQEDWDNPRFVELLTFGWNAGYSERGGVGRVARYVEARGVTNLTIDTIHQNARAAGASRHLSNTNKVRWSKSVAALYLRERARDAARPAA